MRGHGHNYIEVELRRQGVTFRQDDNAFLATSDPQALPAAADKLNAETIEKPLHDWSCLFGPKQTALPYPQNLPTLLHNGSCAACQNMVGRMVLKRG